MNNRLVELNKVDIKTEIAELKKYLNETDYIYACIEEGGRTKEYYADVIEKRKKARLRIRELENE